jgi:hypothetical protein
MGETADQTRAEIVQLRQDMTQRVGELRRAAERPVRVIRAVAIGAVVVVVAGTAFVVVSRVRRRSQEKTLRGRIEKLAQIAASPKRVVGDVADGAAQKLRAEVRRELEQELKRGKPMRERVLEGAARAAATAAVGAVMKGLQERGTKNGSDTNTAK